MNPILKLIGVVTVVALTLTVTQLCSQPRTLDDRLLCANVSNSKQANAAQKPIFAEDIAEAKRRGLNVNACRQLREPVSASARTNSGRSQYDSSWYMATGWSGEYPHGFTMATDVTINIRAMLDPDAPKSVSCFLRKGATYHEWNTGRVASDHLKFVSFTKIKTYVLKTDFTSYLERTSANRSVLIKFKKGDQYSYLFYIGEGNFLIRFRDTIYIAGEGLAEQSTEIGKSSYDGGYNEWLKLQCANGAVGWILFSEIKDTRGFLEPNITDYGSASDQPLGDGTADSKVHINNLPSEAGRIAEEVIAACKDTGEANNDLDNTIDVYEMGNGKRLAVFDPKRICAYKGNGVCSTDGCDVYIYSEQSSGFWAIALQQTITGNFMVEEGRGSTPLRVIINLRGGVPPCTRERQSTCIFELTWRGAGFAWKRLR
jgi:hypothetical protein